MNQKRAAAIAGVMFFLQQEADEREDEFARMDTHQRRNGWSAYGRNAVARGRYMVQGRRIRRSLTGVPTGRRYCPGVTRPCQQEPGIDPSSVPHASGMQISGNRSEE